MHRSIASLLDFHKCYEEHNDMDDTIQVIFENGETAQPIYYTKAAVCQLSEKISKQLLAGNFQKEVIGVCLTTCPEIPSVLIGILKAQSAFLPLPLHTPSERLKYILEELSVRCIITQKDYLYVIQKSLEGVFMAVHCMPDSSLILCCRDEIFNAKKLTREIAYVITTSGTTGMPKTVRVPHSCIVPNIISLLNKFEITKYDVIFHAAPLTFDPSVLEIFLALSAECKLLIVGDKVKNQPTMLARLLSEKHGVTIIQATPSLLSSMGHQTISTTLLSPTSTLRILALGGEPFPQLATFQQWKAEGNNTRVYNIYGITEVSCWATIAEVTDDMIKAKAVVPLGKALENTSLEVVYEPSCPSWSGVLYIGGPGRVCWIELESELDEIGLKRSSGDLVNVSSDGEIYYQGRIDDQIKRLGHRFNLLEIEEIVLRIQSISEAVVAYNKSSNQMHLFVLLQPELTKSVAHRALTEQQIHNVLSSQQLPDHIHFVEQFPRTEHDKVDRKKLLIQNTAVDVQKPLTPAVFQSIIKGLFPSSSFPLSTWLEKSLQELGGDSFTAVRLLNQLTCTPSQPLQQPSMNEAVKLTSSELTQNGSENNSGKHMMDRVETPKISQTESVSAQAGVTVEKTLLEFVLTEPLIMVQEMFTNEPDNNKLTEVDTINVENVQRFIHVNRDNRKRTITSERSDPSDEKGSVQRKCVRSNGTAIYCCSELIPVFSTWTVYQRGSSIASFTSSNYSGSQSVQLLAATSHPHLEAAGSYGHSTGRSCQIMTKNQFVCEKVVGMHEACEESSNSQTQGNELMVKWTYNVGKCLDSSPLVVQFSYSSSVGQTHCYAFIGSHSSRFCCVDLDSEQPVWDVELGGRIESSACMSLSSQFVIVGCYDGSVYTLCTHCGAVYWQFTTGDMVKTSPCLNVQTGHVYVASHDGCCYALDVEAKECVWKCDVKSGGIYASPAWVRDLVIVATFGGSLAAIDQQLGVPKWSVRVDKPFFSSPRVMLESIVIGCTDCNLYAFDLSGNKLWQFATNEPIYSSVSTFTCVSSDSINKSAVTNQLIVFGSHDHHLYCLSANGSLCWKYNCNAAVFSTATVAVLQSSKAQTEQLKKVYKHQQSHNETEVIATLNNINNIATASTANTGVEEITKQNSDTGSTEVSCGSTTVGATEWSAAAESSVVVCCSVDGVVHVLQLLSGQVLAKLQLPGEVFSSPVVCGGYIIVGCRNDLLYKIQLT